SHCARDPRALHSFPTRRSSDLPVKCTFPGSTRSSLPRKRLPSRRALPFTIATALTAKRYRIDSGGRSERRQEPFELRGETVELRSEEHTSELQSRENLVCRLLL